MEHRLAPEQQQTEHCRTNLLVSLDAVEDASARLAALESEAERQRAVASQPPAAGFPYAARTLSKTMLRKAPPTQSGIVGVLDAGVEVLVEEKAVTTQGVARLRVSGTMNGWGNADKFERAQDGVATAATTQDVAARVPLPLDANAAVRLFDGVGAGEDAVRELFEATAGLPAAIGDAEAGRDARAGFLWRLLLASSGNGAVALVDVARFVGRAAARHCLAQPSYTSWGSWQKASTVLAEEGVPPEIQHEPVSAFEARAEAASQAAVRAETAAANLATNLADVQAAMAAAMASGELDQVRDLLSRASDLESQMAKQKEKCAQLAQDAEEATAGLKLAQQQAAEAVASAADQEDDEAAVTLLSDALRRCFEGATTREWSRPDPHVAIDERWLKRWLCMGPPSRPHGEVLLPWLRDLFRPLLPSRLPAVYLPVRLKGDLEAPTTLLRPESAYLLANAIASPKYRVSWRRLFNMDTDGRSFYRLLHCMQLQGPTLFICKDTNGGVFGAFAGESWGEPRTTTFGGARDSFLFQLEPQVSFYWATGEDKNYQYLSTGSASGRQRRPWAADTPLALEPEAKKEVQLPHSDDSSDLGKARWIGFGGSVDIETELFDLGLGFRGDPDLRSGVSHRCNTFGTSGPLSSKPTFEIAALEVWAADGSYARTLKQRAAAEAGMIDKIGGGHGGSAARGMDTEQAAMLELIGQGSLAADIPTDDGERLDRETGTDGA